MGTSRGTLAGGRFARHSLREPGPSFEWSGQRIRPPSQIVRRKARHLPGSRRPIRRLHRGDRSPPGHRPRPRPCLCWLLADAARFRIIGCRRCARPADAAWPCTTYCYSRPRSSADGASPGSSGHASWRGARCLGQGRSIRGRHRRSSSPAAADPSAEFSGGGYAFRSTSLTMNHAGGSSHEEPPPLREDPSQSEDGRPTTPDGRLERWRKRLLDLSAATVFSICHMGGKQALAIDCPDPARLENMLRRHARPAQGMPAAAVPTMAGPDDWQRPAKREDTSCAASARMPIGLMPRRLWQGVNLMVGRDDDGPQGHADRDFPDRAGRPAGRRHEHLVPDDRRASVASERKGKAYRAPIILVPVVLERPSIRSGFSLRVHDDDTRINATLLEMLKQEFDIRFPTLEGERPPADDSGMDVPADPRHIPRQAARHPGMGGHRRRRAYQPVIHEIPDVEGPGRSRRRSSTKANLLARLMDGSHCWSEIPSRPSESERSDAIPTDLDEVAAELVCPLEADSSQLRAVAAARAEKSFVLIGPPGTGKSQTIANIIADTLSQGRTVLFVAQKRAALEVVQRRLRDIGLGDFCLDFSRPKPARRWFWSK